MSKETSTTAAASDPEMAKQLEQLSNRTSLAAIEAMMQTLSDEGADSLEIAAESKSVANHMTGALDELTRSPLWQQNQ